jgi:hypothetical protein
MKISVLCVTYKDDLLIKNLIKSFEHFKPSDYNLQYVIVENSSNSSFKEKVTEGLNDIVYINHADGEKYTINSGKSSIGHGLAYEFGKQYIKHDWTFVCHSDCFITSNSFFQEFKKKVDEGYELIGVCYDSHPNRIQAVHCSGFLIKTDILKKVSMLPDLPKFDTTDKLTEFCRKNNNKIFVFSNTYNDKNLVELINEPFKSLGKDCGVDRCLATETNKVIYMHQGRGTSKLSGQYSVSGKLSTDEWFNICNSIID